MGLDMTYDAFSGAYSAFNRLRQFVAAGMGGSHPPHEDATLDPQSWYCDDAFTRESHPGLYEFMCHSDCDGEISYGKCKKLADELEALMPVFEELEQSGKFASAGHISRDGGYVEAIRRLIAGCRAAYKDKKAIEFL